MKKNFKIFSIIVVALLLVCATVGFSVLAADEAAQSTPTVEIYKKNISYDDVIQLTYALDVDGMTEGQSVQIIFGKSAFTVASEKNVSEYLSETTYVKGQKTGNNITIDGATYPVIFSTGIDAGEMTTKIYAVPVIADAEGNIVASGACVEYSLYDYAMARFYQGTPTADQKALYKALLDYGAAVQDLMLADGQTAPADGWADAYCRVVFCDTMLADDGTYVKGQDTNHIEQFTRPGEVVTLTAAATDKDGHAFQGIYYGGELVGSELTYNYSKNSPDSSYVMAAYKHEYTEETVNAKYLASTASLTSPALFYTTCACGEISSETFEYGTAIPAFTAGGGAYFNNPGSYSYFGTKVDYSTTPTITKTSAAAPTVANGELTANLGAWAHFQVVNTAIITGTKHIVETDIKFSDIVKGTNGNTRFAYISLTADSSSAGASNAFISFNLNLVTDSNGNPIGVEMSSDEGIHEAGYTYITFDIDEWYNVRFEATEISATVTAVEVYINGVHVSDYDTIKVINYKSPSNKINGFAIENRGTSSDPTMNNHAATITLDNTFIGTYDPDHTHEYTVEIASDATFAADATATTPKSYYSSCACGAVSDSEVFYVGVPTFVAGNGAAYGNTDANAYYEGTRYDYSDATVNASSIFVMAGGTAPTLTLNGSNFNINSSVYSVNLLLNTYKHGTATEAAVNVIETDIKFGAGTMNSGTDNLAFLSFSNEKGGNSAGSMGYFNLYGVPVSSSDLTIASYELRGSNNKAVYTFKPGEEANLRLVLDGDVVDVYVNGWLVKENVAVAKGSPNSSKYIAGFGVQYRGVGTFDMTLDNTFVGVKLPAFEAGTGVYYNGDVDLSYFTNKVVYNYDSGAVTDYATTGSNSNSFTNTLSDGRLTSTHLGAWGHWYIKGYSGTSDTHVFETDIMFTRGIVADSATDLRFAWMGLSGNWSGSNGNLATCFYMNAVKGAASDTEGYSYIEQVRMGTDDTTANTLVTFNTDTWYNLKIVAHRNATENVYYVDIYVNGALIQNNVKISSGSSSADMTGKITNWGVCYRGVATQNFSMVYDNTFLGADMTPAE